VPRRGVYKRPALWYSWYHNDERNTMDNDVKKIHRKELARRLRNARDELYAVNDYWVHEDLPGDFLRDDEWPFDASLDEVIADLEKAIENIEFANDFLGLKPMVMVVSRVEYERLQQELEREPRELPRLRALLEQAGPAAD
jgi:hypothetical protein